MSENNLNENRQLKSWAQLQFSGTSPILMIITTTIIDVALMIAEGTWFLRYLS